MSNLHPQKPPISGKASTRCRTASASTHDRSKRLYKELQQASRGRLLKEITRNKVIFDDSGLEKPKPATYHITKARVNYLRKLSTQLPTSSHRENAFGPLLATDTIKQLKPADPTVKPLYSTCKIIDFEANVIPEWLDERSDYQAVVKKLQNIDSNISEICATAAFNRSEDEKAALIKWASSIPFFEKLTLRVLKETCEKLSRQIFKAGEVIIKKGDIGDCLYVIYSGTAEIFLDANIVHGCIGAKAVIGEQALDTLKPRTATIIAQEPVVAFKLTKLDYDTILLNIKKIEKYKSSKLLMTIPFFRNWSYLKVQHLSNFLIQKSFAPGEVIFDKGEESHTFYIIKSGKVDIQAYVQLQHLNRWPTGSQQWKVLEINRKYIVSIAELTRGRYFGESTLIDQMPRDFRAVSVERAVCLTINKDQFFEIFSVKDLEGLQDNTFVKVPNEVELQDKLMGEITEKKYYVRHMQEKAIFNSLEIDFQNPGSRESLLDERTKRLRGWIFNLKKRMKRSNSQFRQRVVAEEKKNVDIDSIVLLNSYCTDKKK